MKKVLIILLAVFMIIGITPVSARNGQSKDNLFSEMLMQIYGDYVNVEIVRETLEGETIDCYEEFISNTYGNYLNNDFNSIYLYMAENNICIIDHATDNMNASSMLPGIDPLGIATCTYQTSYIYKVIYGTGIAGNTVSLPITYRITIRVNYDVATGKVSGTLRNPTVYISSTDGNADEWSVTSVTCSKTKINDYEVRYSNIRFTVSASNSGISQTYSGTHPNITFAPASY